MKPSKKELENQIKILAELAQKGYQNIEEIGVLVGQSGVALFQFYCSKYFDDDSCSDNGVDIIFSCMEKINNGYSYPTYCGGIAGFGWVLQHLADHEFIELDLDELLCPFDDFLNSQMRLDISNGNYDFLHGAMGYGFYFLKRYLSAENEEIKHKYLHMLEGLVDDLNGLAIQDGDLIKWKSVLDIERGNKGFNLSLSHGISSIVYLLSKLYFAGVKKDIIAKLVEGAVKYLLSFEDRHKRDISLFPSWVEPNKGLQYKSRVAWCYGDIGIGLAMDWGSKVLSNNDFSQKALEVWMDVGKRRSQSKTAVVDAGFCHGSFGNAHIFYALHSDKNIDAFEEVANFWIEDSLKRYSGNLDEPYYHWNGITKSMQFELGLLEGISGIGLVMIDLLSEKQNTWDECLMLR